MAAGTGSAGPARDRARTLGASATEALLEILDPGLKRGDEFLQRRQVALEDLAPADLIGEPSLDAPEGLRDRVILLLEPIESPVDLVEVSEHLLSQTGDPLFHRIESTVHRVEPVSDLRESVVDLGEPSPEE